ADEVRQARLSISDQPDPRKIQTEAFRFTQHDSVIFETASINSNREPLAHFRRHTDWAAGLCIDRTPERPSVRKQLPIGAAQNFREPLERKPGGLANPRAQNNLIAQ